MDTSELLQGLTPSQLDAVTHDTGPCLVVAGAGTGKTTVITRRIAYLVLERGVESDKIVALTFTDKAAREMEERVDKALPYGMTGAVLSTFHSFCQDVLRRHSFLLGLDPAAKLMASADEISFLRSHLDELPLRLYKPSANPVEFLKSLSSFLSKLKDEYITPEKFANFAQAKLESATDEAEAEAAQKQVELAAVYTKVQELCAQHSVLSYGDLIYHTVTLLKDFPSVRKEEQQRVHCLMIDEFQDTNFGQNEVARLLAGENGNIMAVGDDDQAIYSFRGASLANIMQFTTTFPGTRIITLLDNFRSTQPILDAAYRLVRHNDPQRLEVQENISKRLVSHRDGGVTPEHRHFDKNFFETQFIAKEIRRLIDEEGYQPSDIAVLVRAKTHIRGLDTALEQEDIPSQWSGDLKFYGEAVVQIALAFLRFLANPHDDLNLFFCLTQEPFRVPERVLQRHLRDAKYRNESLYDLLTALDPADTDPALAQCLSCLGTALEKGSGRKPSVCLLEFLHAEPWHWYASITEQEKAREAELLAFLYGEITAYEQVQQPATIPPYISHIDYLLATDEEISLQQEPDRIAEGVQILTAHRSKGLEFPVVFVTNLVEGRFPGRAMSDPLPFPYELTQEGPPSKEKQVQEERRLAYVAFTRAKERLYLLSSEMYDERKTKAKVSPFVLEALGMNKAPQAIVNQSTAALSQPPVEREPHPAAPIPMPSSFSPSSLETYKTCPKRYEFQYIWSIKVPSSDVSNFGTSVHETLRSWFEAKQNGESPDLDAIYERCWIPGGYENKKYERDRYLEGLEKLRAYLGGDCAVCDPHTLEHSVKIRLANGHTLTGKIDRVDKLPDGRFKVVDYKTSANPKKPREALRDLPLASYILALQQQGKEVVEAELHYVMTGDTVLVPAKDMDLKAISEEAESLINQIRQSVETGTFPHKPDKFKCGYCDYRHICPFAYGKK